MNILITGGAGFIGSSLAHYLAKNKDNQITILDNLSTGFFTNIEDLVLMSNVEFINKNICDNDIKDIIVKNNYNIIYNFACPASPKYYLKHPIETWESSVLGMRNILNSIKNTNIKLLHSSTSEIYGSALESPQAENYWGNVNCIGERACYDEGKRAAEALIFDYKRLYNTDVRVIRIFNTYGPRMNYSDGRVIPNFIKQAISNEDLTIYGNGEQTRSFCYIDDTIEAINKIILKKKC